MGLNGLVRGIDSEKFDKINFLVIWVEWAGRLKVWEELVVKSLWKMGLVKLMGNGPYGGNGPDRTCFGFKIHRI